MGKEKSGKRKKKKVSSLSFFPRFSLFFRLKRKAGKEKRKKFHLYLSFPAFPCFFV
jgi:hypothetical protein